MTPQFHHFDAAYFPSKPAVEGGGADVPQPGGQLLQPCVPLLVRIRQLEQGLRDSLRQSCRLQLPQVVHVEEGERTRAMRSEREVAPGGRMCCLKA